MTRLNPFVAPGLDDDPSQPLCPWQETFGEHASYYSDVGGQHEAFELFQRKLQPGQLSRTSRIVVITGPKLSGKTSLANRCVHWVRTTLEQETVSDQKKPRCHIYPLREVCPRDATVEERVRMVCRRLIEKLRDLNSESGGRLTIDSPAPEEVLPLFGRFHQARKESTQYFIILLPSLEPDTARTEVEKYRAALAGVPGVLCVTECPVDGPFPTDSGEAPPISLHLRHLNPGESRMLVAGWPEAPKKGDDHYRIVREKDLDELEELLATMRGNITLGKLLTALRKIYDDSSGNIDGHRPGRVRYVTYRELVRAYLGEWGRGSV